jgi:hypothetical protein
MDGVDINFSLSKEDLVVGCICYDDVPFPKCFRKCHKNCPQCRTSHFINPFESENQIRNLHIYLVVVGTIVLVLIEISLIPLDL